MVEYVAKANPKSCPMHPGDLLREDILPAIKMGKSELAERLGISRQHLYDVLNERKPVSPDVAARLGRLFGDGASIWLRMQAEHDAWHAERAKGLNKIVPLNAA